jgi:hypothetical protein
MAVHESRRQTPDCIEIIRPFAERLDQARVNGQMIGGIGSHVLGLPGVEIDPVRKQVSYNGSVELPQLRSDGTLRDLDFLVLSTNPDDISAAETIAQDVVGNQLVLSFFGLRSALQLERQRRDVVGSLGKVFVSDRYAETDSTGAITCATKALFPFKAEMSPETLETWTLILPDYELPIPHPGTTVINYATRSIGGLRPKDRQKVNQLTNNIAIVAPWIPEWIVDGPGKSQMELARILQSLRKPESRRKALYIGGDAGGILVQPIDPKTLIDHPNSMVRDQSSTMQHTVLKTTGAKSKIVHIGESQQRLVSYWIENIEPLIGKIVKNEG